MGDAKMRAGSGGARARLCLPEEVLERDWEHLAYENPAA